MGFKIGFMADSDEKKSENVVAPQPSVDVRKSVVDVYFPQRNIKCTYYNDMFDLKRGDIVFVEGKLEGMQGRVVSVNYSFKIKLSDYKRVIAVADTNVKGQFDIAGTHLVAYSRETLSFEQVRSWFLPPSPDEDVVTSAGDDVIDINDLSTLKAEPQIAERGHDYYLNNRVVCIELDGIKARAIVEGSKPYEVEFEYSDGIISSLVCNCFCTCTCKHEVATILQLKETLDILKQDYSKDAPDYFIIINKSVLFDFTVNNQTKATITLS